jgi:nucleotide-binding universal stress UspA family protein
MFSSIVVGTDGSETATRAIREAVGLASALGATLDLVSAYTPDSQRRARVEGEDPSAGPPGRTGTPREVEEALADAAGLAREAGVEVNTHARAGDPADVILDVAEAQQADLVIIGNKGMTGTKRFLLGSVPNKISHHAPCSVLIVQTS